MKRVYLILALLLTFSLACSISGAGDDGSEIISQDEAPPQSEKRCGDGLCDGPENADNCPADCSTEIDAVTEENGFIENQGGSGLLFHLSEHTITSNEMSGVKCYSFNFRKYLDGGYVNMDGSGSAVLELKDFPTSMVSSRKYDNFYYISSPIDPVMEIAGFEMFNWDVENQTLWEANFANNQTVEIANSSDGQFPGGVTASPENGYLVYPLTQKMDSNQDQAMGFLPNNLNPFAADSSLIAANLSSGSESTSLSGSYNRQLFHSFADFSADGSAFFTITRQGQGFDFVKIALESGKATSFSEVFPGFDWNSVNWDEFFPRENDFAYAKFTLSPDQKRLVAYKNIYATNPDNPCATDGLHHLWVFNLENNALESFQNQPGFVSDSSWKPDSAQIALAIMENSGCYPDYLEARIEVFDKDAKNSTILVTESKSKITNIGWSPDGSVIAYDTYTTDYVGRLKMVDVTSRQVNEVINTHSLGYDTSQTNPITLLFANWVSIP